MGPVAPWHVGSSQTRARTRVPCIGRQILNHCATREAPKGDFQVSERNKHVVEMLRQHNVFRPRPKHPRDAIGTRNLYSQKHAKCLKRESSFLNVPTCIFFFNSHSWENLRRMVHKYLQQASLTLFPCFYFSDWLDDYHENAVDKKHLSLQQACHNLD